MKMLCETVLAAMVAVTSCLAMQGAVDVSVGRQLFVDDLLVESVDGVVRYWNHPAKIDNPFVWLPGFSRGDCAAFSRGDSTKTELRFKGGDFSALAGKPVRFRFMIHCATLYSFWVSPSERGESCGYVAGGGPAYKGLRDQ